MRMHFFLLATYFIPALAFVARVPDVDRSENGLLLSRIPENADASKATIARVNVTSNAIATQTFNSTTPSATTVLTLNISTPERDGGTNSTAPGELPIQPAVTPALGVGGFILLATGAVLALIGVRNIWVQVFLSSAFLTSLGVTVLIVYVMNPPVRVAIQGAYLVAIVFTGITFGALAIVFKELAEGLGCLLGGFCTSMWLLCTRPGGLIEASDAKTGFIGAISVAFYAVSFSHYTRPYGLMVSTSIAGGTVVSLGVDCYSKAGLKEFWLYLWALNDDIFPLGTDTYPVTRYMKVELAATVIVAIMGVISQLRLWKVIRERRARENEKQQEEQRKRDEAEAEVGKRLEEDNMKERMEWEAKFGDHQPGASESSTSIPELAACHTNEGNGKGKVKDEATEEKSISDSVVSYRCSDCRARGEDDTSDTNTNGSETHRQDTESADRDTFTLSQNAEGNDGHPKALRGAITDDQSSDMTATVGSETVSVYSKRFSMLSRKSSVKSAAKSVKTPAKPVSESQEALIAHDDDADSTFAVVDDVDSDCHTAATDSQYQAMLDEERPATAQELVATNVFPVEEADEQAHGESDSAAKEMPQPTGPSSPSEIDQPQTAANDEITPNTPNPEEPVSPVETNCQENTENESVESPAKQLQDSFEADVRSDKGVPVKQQAITAEDIAQSEDKTAVNQCSDHCPPKKHAKDKAGEHKVRGETIEAQSDKSTEDEVGQAVIKGETRGDLATPEPANDGNKSLKLLTKKDPSKEQTAKKEPKRLNAETVQQIPKHTSKVVQAYRMNEWAKHLTNADIPEPEPIQPFEDQQADPAEEEAAPVNVAELLQTPLNAQPLPAVQSRKDTNENRHAHDSQEGSQKRKNSPKRHSGQSIGSARLSQNSHPAVQPLGNVATPSSVTLLSSAEQARNESEKAKPRWKGPAPLIAVREDIMRSRLSSLSLPTDPYARHSTGQFPTDFISRYPSGSTFAIPEEEDDNIPLSQRRTMLHQQAAPVAPTNAAPSRWNNSGMPSRANSPAVLAAWRESVREDLGGRDPLKLAQSINPIPGDRSSLGHKIAEGMQRGDMSELHREALRRMQAKANQSVNRMPKHTTAPLSTTSLPSPAKTAQSRSFRDLPIIPSTQIKEPVPSHPPPRSAFQPPRSPTALPPSNSERLGITSETQTPATSPLRARSSFLQNRWAPPKILRPPAVRLANPVNYVPRITPVTAVAQASNESLLLGPHRDAYPLLTIPERRRSRLTPSPNSLVVERSQQESESGRSSIAVPRGRHSDAFEDVPLEMETAARAERTVGEDRPRHVQSQHSLRSQSAIASIPSNSGQPNEPDVAEELAWGPAHPCFPHINPHVPPGSDEYLTTRIIRIRRDWMVKGDLAPTYSNLYPEILDPLLPEQEFRRIIATVNEELTSAFDPFSFRNWIDGAIGLITGWIWDDIGAPGIKSHLRRVEEWLEKWNREVGAKDGVRIWGLRRTAYMSLDIQIPDPKVGIVPSEENPSRPGTRPDSGGV